MNEEIKELRLFLKLSQSEFARELGVSVDAVRRWEQQRSKPSNLAYEKISQLVKKNKKAGAKGIEP